MYAHAGGSEKIEENHYSLEISHADFLSHISLYVLDLDLFAHLSIT